MKIKHLNVDNQMHIYVLMWDQMAPKINVDNQMIIFY